MRATHIVITLALLGFLSSAHAGPSLIPAPPQVEGRGYLLMDFQSGQILAESNANARMEPASLTKMLSAYVVSYEIKVGKIRLNDPVRISEYAWRQTGSRMFVEAGKTVTVAELLKGVIIQSGNDATVALAEHTAGSEEAFTSLLNQHAERLGMKGSHFMNSTGLPHPEHYTTPRDLALLAQALIRDFPEDYSLYSVKEFTYNRITQHNRNLLLWRDPTVDGIKTGHTDSAGFCLVASAQSNNMRLISVVLGTKSEEARAAESQKLLTYGFRFFETHRLYTANTALTKVHVWKGATEELPLGLTQDLYITIPRGQYSKLDASMDVPSKLVAPMKKGAALGKVNVRLNGDSYAERPLYALADVESGGFFGNLIDDIKLLLE